MTEASAVDEPSRRDWLREQLLDAAARVFARQGYSGTKVLDVVREAGLSTGAVYGRFKSKNDLLRAAVIRQTAKASRLGQGAARVADLVTGGSRLHHAPLSDIEAVRLEALVAARREPEVAAAIAEVLTEWRSRLQPLVEAAREDGTVADGVDPEAVLYFVRTVYFGLLLQRGAGIAAPDPDGWNGLIERVVASFGHPQAFPWRSGIEEDL